MEPLNVYACYNVDKELRLNSSSGAVFSSLAECVLSKQGVVYGVTMSEDCYSVKYLAVRDKKEFAKLRGSKYLQAKMGNTYCQVKIDLESGETVLFSGTGCQINGLKKYLGKDYENLICVDVICHGVPSPALWKEYVLHQEKLNGGKLKVVNFRCKDESWEKFGMKELINDRSEDSLKNLYISSDKDSFMRMFLRDYCLRPSCYECVAKQEKLADITIADFWGIDNVAPEMNDGNGTSLVIIRTNKGFQVFDEIKECTKRKEVSYSDGVKSNPAEYRSCTRPPQRENFFRDMQVMEFDELEKKYAADIKISWKGKIVRFIIALLIKISQVFGGERKKE